jgi:hypothetical protein
VDGTVRRTYARPEADEFLNQWNDHTAGAYMMLNIHAKNATWMGGNLSCSNLPRIMEVDYVRAYQKSGTTPPPPAPTGLLQNPGFETGTLSPWTSWGNNSVITSGQRSGSRGIMAWWNSTVEQVVTGLTPNTTYTFGGWAKVDAAGISARLSVKDHGGVQVYSPNFTSTSAFTQSSVTFTTGSSSTSARVMFYAPTYGGAWAMIYPDGRHGQPRGLRNLPRNGRSRLAGFIPTRPDATHAATGGPQAAGNATGPG